MQSVAFINSKLDRASDLDDFVTILQIFLQQRWKSLRQQVPPGITEEKDWPSLLKMCDLSSDTPSQVWYLLALGDA